MAAPYALASSTGLSAREFISMLLNRAISRVNEGASRTLTARLSSERPPHDARHLTDTRTRVSQLLEYAVAYEMNRVLEEEAHGFSISAVLWNIFPDLIVRTETRANELGLEVKALHTAAEEKSANFSTPVQIVRKDQDFILILTWGWQKTDVANVSIVYPHIHSAAVFDAWLLAKIRDYYWLSTQNQRIKGIDLCSQIIDSPGNKFKAEEGNSGKLMRIRLPTNLPSTAPFLAEMTSENAIYAQFLDRVLAMGLRETFLDVCMVDGATPQDVAAPVSYPQHPSFLGRAIRLNGTRLSLGAGPRFDRWLATLGPSDASEGDLILWLGQKLSWQVLRLAGGQWLTAGSGTKPDSALSSIKEALDLQGS